MNLTISIDSRHTRPVDALRDGQLELPGLYRRMTKESLKNHLVRSTLRIQNQIVGKHMELDPTPDQDWREGRVRPVPAGMEG